MSHDGGGGGGGVYVSSEISTHVLLPAKVFRKRRGGAFCFYVQGGALLPKSLK
jgi:hypothetical protein